MSKMDELHFGKHNRYNYASLCIKIKQDCIVFRRFVQNILQFKDMLEILYRFYYQNVYITVVPSCSFNSHNSPFHSFMFTILCRQVFNFVFNYFVSCTNSARACFNVWSVNCSGISCYSNVMMIKIIFQN